MFATVEVLLQLDVAHRQFFPQHEVRHRKLMAFGQYKVQELCEILDTSIWQIVFSLNTEKFIKRVLPEDRFMGM